MVAAAGSLMARHRLFAGRVLKFLSFLIQRRRMPGRSATPARSHNEIRSSTCIGAERSMVEQRSDTRKTTRRARTQHRRTANIDSLTGCDAHPSAPVRHGCDPCRVQLVGLRCERNERANTACLDQHPSKALIDEGRGAACTSSRRPPQVLGDERYLEFETVSMMKILSQGALKPTRVRPRCGIGSTAPIRQRYSQLRRGA